MPDPAKGPPKGLAAYVDANVRSLINRMDDLRRQIVRHTANQAPHSPCTDCEQLKHLAAAVRVLSSRLDDFAVKLTAHVDPTPSHAIRNLTARLDDIFRRLDRLALCVHDHLSVSLLTAIVQTLPAEPDDGKTLPEPDPRDQQ